MTLLNKLKNFKPIKLTQDFLENLTKKQVLVLASLIPLGVLIGMALNVSFTKIAGRNLEKYNIESFLISDTLKIDTIIRKKGEIYRDTLIDYSRLSREEIKFKDGFLFVKNKEFSKYKLLKNGTPSKEILGKNNETKTYHLIWDFFGKGFKLNKLELMRYGADSNFLNDYFNINPINKKDTYEVYTKEKYSGKRMWDSEQEAVKKYLNKIAEYKKSLKD